MPQLIININPAISAKHPVMATIPAPRGVNKRAIYTIAKSMIIAIVDDAMIAIVVVYLFGQYYLKGPVASVPAFQIS